MLQILLESFKETLVMVLSSGIIAILIGVPLGILLLSTNNKQILPSRKLHFLLTSLTSAFSYIPCLIILIACIPITKWLVNNNISATIAAILPLSIAATPSLALAVFRIIKSLPNELSMMGNIIGASPMQTLKQILIPEAYPEIVRAITSTLISLIGFSTIAGVLGAGGLGNLAINKAYYAFDKDYILATVGIIIATSYFIHLSGSFVARQATKR